MGSSYFQGAADPGSSSTEFNALDFHIEQKISQISTAMMVKIIKGPYDTDGNAIVPGTAGPIGYVDVQPLVNQIDGNGNPTPHGVVHRLSYLRYQGGNGSFISDPVVGDVGKMVVADRDTSSVRANGGQVSNPGSARKFDKADGTFFGSVVAGAPGQYFAWSAKGFTIVDLFGNVIQGTASGVLINGCLIDLSGDVTTKHGTVLDTHHHTLTQPGSGNSGPPP